MQKVEIDRFAAEDVHAGKHYTVVKLQRVVEHQMLDGSVEKSKGSIEWVTACGLDLNENSDGTFEIIQIDGILKRLT